MPNLKLASSALIASAAFAGALALPSNALADDAQENKILRDQMQKMMERMDALQKQVDTLKQQQSAPPVVVTPPPSPLPPPAALPAPAVSVAQTPVEKEPLLHKILSGFYGTLD